MGSALSDPYYAWAAGLCGLAGPLHGLANQDRDVCNQRGGPGSLVVGGGQNFLVKFYYVYIFWVYGIPLYTYAYTLNMRYLLNGF